MQLKDTDIEDFQALCKKEFSVELDRDSAASELRALLELIRLLLGLE